MMSPRPCSVTCGRSTREVLSHVCILSLLGFVEQRNPIFVSSNMIVCFLLSKHSRFRPCGVSGTTVNQMKPPETWGEVRPGRASVQVSPAEEQGSQFFLWRPPHRGSELDLTCGDMWCLAADPFGNFWKCHKIILLKRFINKFFLLVLNGSGSWFGSKHLHFPASLYSGVSTHAECLVVHQPVPPRHVPAVPASNTPSVRQKRKDKSSCR